MDGYALLDNLLERYKFLYKSAKKPEDRVYFGPAPVVGK
jgi:hypothetical protein